MASSAEINAILNQYFTQKVQLPEGEMERNTKYVNDRIMPMVQYIQANTSAFTGEILGVGSSYSGTKVERADEFDLHIPLNVSQGDRTTLSFTTHGQRYYGFNDERYDSGDIKTIPNHIDVIHRPEKALRAPPQAHGFVQCPVWTACNPRYGCDGDIIPFLARRELKNLLVDGRNQLPEYIKGNFANGQSSKGELCFIILLYLC